MNFVESEVEKWEQQIPPLTKNKIEFREAYLKAMYEHIERCGRVCYKSEDKVGEKDPKIFVNRLINSGHLSVLEHGTVYLKIEDCFENDLDINILKINPYTITKSEWDRKRGKWYCYITTNYRVIIENELEYELKFLSVPTEHHELRHTFCCTTDIGVSREFNRH